MKICYIIDAHTVLTQRIAEHFASIGHQIQVLCGTSMYPNTNEGIEVIELGVAKKLLNIPYTEHLDNVLRIKNHVSSYDPDIVHGHYMTTAAAHVIGIDNKYPVVLSAWGSDVLIDAEAKHHRILIKKACKRADRITSVAEHITKKLVNMDVAGQKISTFPFGVDADKFKPGAEIKDLRKRLGIEPGDKVVISTRMFEPVYNVALLIDVVPGLLKALGDIKVVLVGRGSLEPELKAAVVRQMVEDAVVFTGFVMYNELPGYLNITDAYVSTSRSDGASVSLLEAMACGVVPIATDIPANRDWIMPGRNGYLFPTDDPLTLKDRIVGAVEDPDFALSAASINRRLVEEKGSWKNAMKKLEEIYNSLIP